MTKPTRRNKAMESGEEGFWDRPLLINLVADLLIVFACAALAWAAANALRRLPVFPLRAVVVAGTMDNVTRDQIEQAAKLALTGNFFTIDLDQVRAVFEKLPWVRRAEVRRHWPDTLEMAIEEHVAVARWRRADGETRLVNQDGEVFAAASDQILPTFVGPDGSSALVLDRYREFSAALAGLGRKPETVALSNREAWQMKLDDGLIVELGRDEAKHSLSERVHRFASWYRPALAQAGLSRALVVDMRYPNGFVLRLPPPEQKS
ncbi:MAG: cell division protein FtsQ/DivIB [Zoogloeaceae bacterium]|jgi:cell division protein FtsQ|nr:cell division protein FtsQ/DivIB [Zoogloeaceae bacterium]